MDRSNESLSALTDDELDGKGADFLIRRVSSDRDLSERWQRVHLIRACLQREFTGPASLVGKVAAAIEAEPAPQRVGAWSSGLLRVGFGGAIAASVALVAVIGLGNRVDPGGLSEDAAQPGFVSQSTALDRQFSPTAVPAGLGSNTARGGTPATSAAAQRQINRYMIRHSQLAGEGGFISFTPVLTAPTSVQTVRPAGDGPGGDDAQESAAQ